MKDMQFIGRIFLIISCFEKAAAAYDFYHHALLMGFPKVPS